MIDPHWRKRNLKAMDPRQHGLASVLVRQIFQPWIRRVLVYIEIAIQLTADQGAFQLVAKIAVLY